MGKVFLVIVLVGVGGFVASFVLRAQAAQKQKVAKTGHAHDALARLSAALERSGALDGRLAAQPWDEVRAQVFDVRLRAQSALMDNGASAVAPSLETLSNACMDLLEHPADIDDDTARRATGEFCERAKLVRPLLPPPG
jgi:hypothetical protein